jgi:hypothetical protein
MKPVEPSPCCTWCGPCGWLQSLLWCPPKEEEKQNGNGNGEQKNGNGEKKNGNGEKKNGEGEKKNGEGEAAKEEEKKEEEPPTLTPLMQILQCYCPGTYRHMTCDEKNQTKLYGWIQQGFTANFDSPRDRTNFGTSFNFRSNDYRLNQVYFVLENPLEHEDHFNVGYRFDFLAGTDAPWIAAVSLGLFDNFTAGDLDQVGIELPQFYVEAHLPGVITQKGLDVRIGRMYTLMGHRWLG